MKLLKRTAHDETFHTAPTYLEHRSPVEWIILVVYPGNALLMPSGPKSYASNFAASYSQLANMASGEVRHV